MKIAQTKVIYGIAAGTIAASSGYLYYTSKDNGALAADIPTSCPSISKGDIVRTLYFKQSDATYVNGNMGPELSKGPYIDGAQFVKFDGNIYRFIKFGSKDDGVSGMLPLHNKSDGKWYIVSSEPIATVSKTIKALTKYDQRVYSMGNTPFNGLYRVDGKVNNKGQVESGTMLVCYSKDGGKTLTSYPAIDSGFSQVTVIQDLAN